MEILRYSIKLHKADDGITVTFPDMPYGVTCGETYEEAMDNAIDCLEEIIASLMKSKKDIPKHNPTCKHPTIMLSPAFSAKVLLYKALRERHMTKAELARRLNWKYPQVDRLFDTHHRSQFTQLAAAATALGKTFIIGMEDAHDTK